jgi:hypothetical protein
VYFGDIVATPLLAASHVNVVTILSPSKGDKTNGPLGAGALRASPKGATNGFMASVHEANEISKNAKVVIFKIFFIVSVFLI